MSFNRDVNYAGWSAAIFCNSFHSAENQLKTIKAAITISTDKTNLLPVPKTPSINFPNRCVSRKRLDYKECGLKSLL
jgi:hypothetical protein